uniref:Carboxypeptidase regulatory-like domain-containing protein n=1 Tax=Oscillatoriales cyanobacterium SpSt-402 TaxID=2282168 RepID=A0A832H5T7_9CYAN
MPEQRNSTPGDFAPQTLIQQAATASLFNLQHLVNLQDQQTARLTALESKLRKELGDDHPKVEQVQQSLAIANQLKQSLQTTSNRVARRPKPICNNWVVSGQVLNQEGVPLAGLRIRVFDRDRKLDKLLGETKTDEFGDFALTYRDRDFAQSGDTIPDLFVMVQDAQGKLLYTSKNSIRYKSSHQDFFEIILNQKPN